MFRNNGIELLWFCESTWLKSPQQKLKEWSCLHIDSNEINFIFEDENMFDVYSFTGRVIDPVGVNFNVMNLNWP